jgi:uroporphyrinogen-III synthase
LLSTLSADYFFVRPFHSLVINATDGMYFAAFVVCALAASWVSAAKKANEETLVKARNQLEIRVSDRTAELAKSIEQFRFDIALLNKTASRLSAADPLHQVLNEVVEFVTAVVECDSCMVYAMEGDELVLRASKNPHPEAIDCLKMRVGQGITGWVAEHRTPVAVTQSAYDDPRFKLFNELPEDRFEAFLSVPLVSGGHLVGVINLQSRTPHQYSEREIGLVSAIGFLVGAEVERARLETEKSELSDRLETRKLVERAKGILQRELKINEAEAYRLLQRESQQHRKSMKDLSESIVWQDDLKRGSSS